LLNTAHQCEFKIVDRQEEKEIERGGSRERGRWERERDRVKEV